MLDDDVVADAAAPPIAVGLSLAESQALRYELRRAAAKVTIRQPDSCRPETVTAEAEAFSDDDALDVAREVLGDWLPEDQLDEGARDLVAGGYELLQPAHGTPFLHFYANRWSVMERVRDRHLPVRRLRPHVAVTAGRRVIARPRQRQPRAQRRRAPAATRGDPSRPRPADDDDLASRHEAGVAA